MLQGVIKAELEEAEQMLGEFVLGDELHLDLKIAQCRFMRFLESRAAEAKSTAELLFLQYQGVTTIDPEALGLYLRQLSSLADQAWNE